MVFVVGDTHGNNDILKIFNPKNEEFKNLTKDDYLIILGDFGCIWDGGAKEKILLDRLNNCDFTTLWIDGNHENFDLINKYPVEMWKGGRIHRIPGYNNIFHLMRGEVFTIEGKKIFTFGGASSIDKIYRVEYVSWWKEELPSYFEMQNGLMNLEENNYEVDFILTHTCSKSTFEYIAAMEKYRDKKIDPLMKYLEEIKKHTSYEKWFFGHYHIDHVISDKEVAVYNNIIRII